MDVRKIRNRIMPLNLAADWTGGNPVEPAELRATTDIRTFKKHAHRRDEAGRGTAGDLDDINANKHPPLRRLG